MRMKIIQISEIKIIFEARKNMCVCDKSTQNKRERERESEQKKKRQTNSDNDHRRKYDTFFLLRMLLLELKIFLFLLSHCDLPLLERILFFSFFFLLMAYIDDLFVCVGCLNTRKRRNGKNKKREEEEEEKRLRMSSFRFDRRRLSMIFKLSYLSSPSLQAYA